MSNCKLSRTLNFFLPLIVFFLLLRNISSNSNMIDEEFLDFTEENFNTAIKENKNIFVLFYRLLSQEQVDEYEKILSVFKKAHDFLKLDNKLNLKFAVSDLVYKRQFTEHLKINKFPTLRLYTKEASVLYKRIFSLDHILEFLNEKFNFNIKQIDSTNKLKEYVHNKEVAVFFREPSEENQQYNLFLNYAINTEDVLFAVCKSIECSKDYNAASNNVIFFNGNINKEFELNVEFTEQDLDKFISKNKSKVFPKMDDLIFKLIFAQRNVGLFLHINRTDPNYLKYELIINKVSKNYKGIIYFLITDIKEDVEKNLAEAFKIKEKDLPCVYIYDARFDYLPSYKFKMDITEFNLIKFIEEFLEGKLEPFYVSEQEIEDDKQTYPVMKIVGKSFQRLILNDESNHSFVYYYSNDCKHCHKAGLLFERLAEIMANSNKNLIFAKFDTDKNEYKNYVVNALPTFRLFPAGKKDKYEDYPLDRSRHLVAIAKFLKKHIDVEIGNVTDKEEKIFEEEYEDIFKIKLEGKDEENQSDL